MSKVSEYVSSFFDQGGCVSKEEEVLNATFESLRLRAIEVRTDFDRHIHDLMEEFQQIHKGLERLGTRFRVLERRAEKLEEALGAKSKEELDAILYVLQLLRKVQSNRRRACG